MASSVMASVRRLTLLCLLVFVATAMADFAMEGDEYSLNCTGEGDVLYWMLHGKGTAYMKGQDYTDVSITVQDDGTITFKKVMTQFDGEHLCVTQSSSTEVMGHSVPMKVRALPPTDLWDAMYRAQFVTGLIAALVCAFLFTAGCLVFRYRYKEPKRVLLNGTEEGGHFNPALDVDADASSGSTKM